MCTNEAVAIKKNIEIFPYGLEDQDEYILYHNNTLVHSMLASPTLRLSSGTDSSSKKYDGHSVTTQKRILRELKILHKFNHPNVISLRGVIAPENFRDLSDVYLVTELMSCMFISHN